MAPCLRHAGIRGQVCPIHSVLRYIWRLPGSGGLRPDERVVYRLSSGKHRLILTYFQTKVNKKISSLLDSICLILEKSFTAKNAEGAEKDLAAN